MQESGKKITKKDLIYWSILIVGIIVATAIAVITTSNSVRDSTIENIGNRIIEVLGGDPSESAEIDDEENAHMIDIINEDAIINAIQTGISALEAENQAKQARISTLETENQEQRTTIEGYQTQISNLETENRQITAIEREHQAQVSALENDINNLQAEIDIFIARGEPPVPRDSEGRPASIMSLRHMTSIQDRLEHSYIIRDNFQNEYQDVVAFAITNNERNFLTLLDGRYTRLRGTAFISYGTTFSYETTLRFELDGRRVEIHTMDRTSRPIQIDIDLTNVNEFRIYRSRIRTTVRGGQWAPNIYFADFRFYP